MYFFRLVVLLALLLAVAFNGQKIADKVSAEVHRRTAEELANQKVEKGAWSPLPTAPAKRLGH